MRWIIFAGRFQPFHIGHWRVVKQVIPQLQAQDQLILATVAPMAAAEDSITAKPIDAGFAATAQEHHLPERNPWSTAQRLLALRAIAQQVETSHPNLSIATTAIPRPAYGWAFIQAWFPGERVWVIPKAGEAFDEAKNEFFLNQGDQTLRVEDNSQISGRELRQLWADHQVAAMQPYIPACLYGIYSSHVSGASVRNFMF